MVLWEYDLRRECEQALVVGYINHKVRGSDIHEVRRKLDVGFDLGKIGEIRRRVATKNKINMR